jgi:tetratricopeptide (TPR) repeat protein
MLETISLRIPVLENDQHSEAVASPNGGEDLERLSSPISCAQEAAADRRSRLSWMLGLALLAFAARAFGILAKFVFDDVFNIEHRSVADLSGLSRFFTTDSSAFFGSNFYRPVLNVWFEVAYKLLGPNAPAWHVLSILVHVACTLLVFRLALALVGNSKAETLVAGVAAALFAVHPAHTEAISWASAMGDPLMTMFLLLSVLGFLRWTKQGNLLWWVASFVAAAACVLTKEPGVMLPVVLLVSALALRCDAKPVKPVLLAALPFFVLSAGFLVLRQHVLGAFSHPLTQASTAQMIYTWPSALLFYLRHMILPPVVVPYYPVFIVQSWRSWQFFGPLLGLVAASGALGFLLWRAAGWRKFCFCLAWILAPLAPVLYVKALAPFELVHDRFLYAPLVGFCIAAALVLGVATHWIEERLQCRVLPLVAVVLILLLSIESLKQMLWWQNNMTLFTRAVAVTPNNPRALGGLADANLALGHNDEAARLFQRALLLDPQDSPAMFALGRIAWLRGDDTTAEKYLLQALSIQPRYDMWLHLASIEMHRNNLDNAEAAVRQALAMNPTGAGAHAALGIILLTKGDRAAAAAEFQEELRLYPQSDVAQVGLSRATGNAAVGATGNVTGNAPGPVRGAAPH